LVEHLGSLSAPTYEAEIIKQIASLAGKRVLELGCGLAPHARLISDLTQSYIAIDVSQRKLIDSLKSGRSGKTQLLCSNAIKLPFNSDSFDRIIMAHFIHEVDCSLQIEVMKEIHRVLVPGGKIIILDTIEKTSEFQRCFDIVHENFQYYKHQFNLKHSKWLIDKLISTGMLLLEEQQKESLDFHFSSIDQITKLLVEDFKYEYAFSQLEENKISLTLAKMFRKKAGTNPIIINEKLDVCVLSNQK